MELIDCKNVSMSYEGVMALNNISFSVDAGDFISILGENGSGKSTLVKGILGLKTCDSGSISYKGINQNEIGYLPQQTAIQRDFPATVLEVVRSGCIGSMGMRPFYTKHEKQRTMECIGKLRLENITRRCYRDLSGGQQQRVLLARALCATEKMLLLDEPVSGLDPIVTVELYDVINKLNKEQGVTIIMISHDVRCSLKYSNKILHINSYKNFFGSAEEYRETDLYKLMGGCEHD